MGFGVWIGMATAIMTGETVSDGISVSQRDSIEAGTAVYPRVKAFEQTVQMNARSSS